jgi:hypothetical protein
VRVLLQEGNFVARHFSELPEFRARGKRRARFHRSARPFPFQWHAVGNKAIDRVSHVGEPGASPHFPVGHDVQSYLALLFEDLKNRAVLRGAKLFQRETACGMRRASLQQVRRAKQTANVLRTIGDRHGELFPRLMEAVLFVQFFEKQRNSIGGKSGRQGTPFAMRFPRRRKVLQVFA